jgi:Fe-S-cluster containining protein
MSTAAENHRRVDWFIQSTFAANPDTPHCCRAGCHTCCSEAVYASQAEINHIVESLSTQQVEQLKPRLVDWLARTEELRKEPYPKVDKYLGSNIPCPLLQGGLCSVYERRPFGCRVWFAFGDPQNCRLPMRHHQGLAQFSNALFEAMGLPAIVNGRLILDHLGVLLAERLLGLDIPSASRDDVDASKMKMPPAV